MIASINSRVPSPSWRAGPTSLVRESFSEVCTYIYIDYIASLYSIHIVYLVYNFFMFHIV